MISILIGGVSLTPSGRPAPTPVAIYTSEACILHDPGMRMGEVLPEQPARLANLIHAMRTQWAGEYGELLQIREPEVDVTKEQLLRVHTEQYLDTLDGFFKRLERPAAGGIRPRVNLDQDTVVAANSQAAAPEPRDWYVQQWMRFLVGVSTTSLLRAAAASAIVQSQGTACDEPL